MQVTLCLMVAFASALDGIFGIQVYNKFGGYTKKLYNDFHPRQSNGFNVGLPNTLPKSYFINKGFIKYPPKQNFVYNTGYIGQPNQPVGKRIILNNLPTENIANNAQIVRIIYPNLGNVQQRAFNVLQDKPTIPTAPVYISQNLGNIVQSRNIIQEDLTNAYKTASGYTTNLGDFHAKATYIKASEPEVLRIFQNNVDVADRCNDYVAPDGTIYKLLPEDEKPRYQTVFSGASFDQTQIDANGPVQIIKSIEPPSAYSTTDFGGDNQVQFVDQPVSLNTGEVVLQQLDGSIPQSELLKLFS